MRRVLSIVLTSVITTYLSAAGHAQAPASAQQPAATFKTDVNLVEVHAVVTDERGNFVGNLAREDFEIYEAGQTAETERLPPRRCARRRIRRPVCHPNRSRCA